MWYPQNASLMLYISLHQTHSPVTLLFILKNRLGLLNSQSNSGVQSPSALRVSRMLGAVTTLAGILIDIPVPILTAPILSRCWLLTPVRNEKIVLLGLGGSTGLLGESSSCHGPPRRVMIRCCSLLRQRCLCSAVDGGSRDDVSIWIVGRGGTSFDCLLNND